MGGGEIRSRDYLLTAFVRDSLATQTVRIEQPPFASLIPVLRTHGSQRS